MARANGRHRSPPIPVRETEASRSPSPDQLAQVQPLTMKSFAFTLLALLALAPSAAYAQSRNVSFLHGIGSAGSTWDPAVSTLNARFYINAQNRSYNSDRPISTIASQDASYLVQQNAVTVGHSMGGLVAREIVRQQGTGRVSALITTGTPHQGAFIANALDSTAPGTVFGWWVSDLAAGWTPYLYYNYPAGYALGQAALSSLLGYLADYFNDLNDLASFDDLKPASSFLSTLNQSSAPRPYNF